MLSVFLKVIAIFLVMDFVYLSLMTTHFKKLVRNIQNSELNLRLFPTAMVYIYILSAWYYFIYEPKVHMTKKESVINSFVLGFLTYGIYDFTNMAIFDKWDLKTAIIDNIWGGVLFSVPTFLVI